MDNFDDSITPTASASAVATTARARHYALNGKIMLCTVVVLFVALFAILGFRSYACWFIHRRRSRSIRHRHYNGDSAPSAAGSSFLGGGLDLSVLKSLPVFTFVSYRDGDVGQFIECAVCLSDFEDVETGRRLPICEHVFHADCIDEWFAYRSSCPLCRAPVQADFQAATDGIPPEDVSGAAAAQGLVRLVEVSESESSMSSSVSSSPSLFSSCRGSCSSPPPPGKAVELEGITVEEPRLAMEETYKGLEKMDLPERNRSKFTGHRILSLKRIWSI